MFKRAQESAYITTQQAIIAQMGESNEAYQAIRATFSLIKQAQTTRELFTIVSQTEAQYR